MQHILEDSTKAVKNLLEDGRKTLADIMSTTTGRFLTAREVTLAQGAFLIKGLQWIHSLLEDTAQVK